MATVVAKLFNIVGPDKAFFGQNPAAQVAVLRKMVQELNFPLEPVVCPTVREPDGLAMSSRNRYLSAEERRQALVLSRALREVSRLVPRAEVNSNQIPLPGITTAGTNFDCGQIQASGNAATAGSDWTTDFQAIQCYDQLKVNAVVNWINGNHHLGHGNAPVPVVFGINFQAVSVGEKLIENGVYGGYTDGAGDATPSLTSEITFVDGAIGQMVQALKNQGLLESTTIIITSKHGQSPIDPNRFFPIPGHSGANGTSPANLLEAQGYVPALELAGPGPTEDDISQLWLSPGNTTATNTAAAVGYLENNAKMAGIGESSTSRRSRRCSMRPACPP